MGDIENAAIFRQRFVASSDLPKTYAGNAGSVHKCLV